MSYMYARNLSCKRRTGFNKMEKNLSVILKSFGFFFLISFYSRKISFEKYMYILEIKEYRAFFLYKHVNECSYTSNSVHLYLIYNQLDLQYTGNLVWRIVILDTTTFFFPESCRHLFVSSGD